MSEIVQNTSDKKVYSGASSVDPYQSQKSNIKQTFWDKVANSLGMRSAYDKMMMDLNMQSNLRQDQLNMLEDEAKFNSEAEKVSRMKEAGLNPDLQGIGDASEAGEFNEPQSTPMASDYQSSEAQVADAFKGVVDLGLGLFTGFQQVRGLMIDNGAKAVNRYKSVQQLAKEIVDNSLLPPGLEVLEKDPDSGRDVWTVLSGNKLDYDEIVQKYGKDRVRYTVPSYYIPDVDFLRGKDRKAFDNELNRYKRSIFADGKKYQEYFKYLNDRKNSALSSSSPFNDPSYRGLETLFQPISKLMFDVNKASLTLQSTQIANQQKYENEYISSDAAAADNARNQSAKSLEEYNKQVNDAWKTASDAIENFGKSNPVLGMIGMVLLNWLRSNMPMPQLPGSHHTNIYDNSDKRTYNDTSAERIVNVNN